MTDNFVQEISGALGPSDWILGDEAQKWSRDWLSSTTHRWSLVKFNFGVYFIIWKITSLMLPAPAGSRSVGNPENCLNALGSGVTWTY